jgi:hypothetical protein
VEFFRKAGQSLDYRLTGHRFSKGWTLFLDYLIQRNVRRDVRFLRNEVIYSPRNEDFVSLCDKYGSDKGSLLTENHPYPWEPHTYASLYSFLFSHCRDSFKQVLECGIGTNDPNLKSNMSKSGMPGASLRVWRDFFPNAQVIGIDIDEKTMFKDDRINTYVVDQTDVHSIRSFLNEFSKTTFDLVIDDGLHEFHAGKNLFQEIFPRLSQSGIYVIEDVLMQDLKKYKEYFSNTNHDVTYILLGRKKVKIGDNCLILVRRHQST